MDGSITPLFAAGDFCLSVEPADMGCSVNSWEPIVWRVKVLRFARRQRDSLALSCSPSLWGCADNYQALSRLPRSPSKASKYVESYMGALWPHKYQLQFSAAIEACIVVIIFIPSVSPLNSSLAVLSHISGAQIPGPRCEHRSRKAVQKKRSGYQYF